MAYFKKNLIWMGWFCVLSVSTFASGDDMLGAARMAGTTDASTEQITGLEIPEQTVYPIRVNSDQGKNARAIFFRGHYRRKGWRLNWKSDRVIVGEDQSFVVPIPVHGAMIEAQFNAIGPRGEREAQTFRWVVDSRESVRQDSRFSISAAGVLNRALLSESASGGSTIAVAARTGWGGEVALQYRLLDRIWIFDHVSMDVGAGWIQRKYDQTKSSLTTYRLQAVELPVMVRLGWKEIFSFGAGMYLAYGMGEIATQEQQSSQVLSLSYALLRMRRLDWGAAFSGGLRFPLSRSRWDLLMDLRYQLGFADVSEDADVASRFRDLWIVSGFRYRF